MDHRRHNRLTALLLGAGAALVVGFTVAVDAVGLWQSPAVPGFNAFKPLANDYEEAFKAAAYARRPTAVVFLGSSRVKMALRPATYAALTGRDAFNLGLGGMPPLGSAAFYRHAAYHRPDLAEVVWGIAAPELGGDTGARDASVLVADEGRLAKPGPPWRDWLQHGFTATAIVNAVATVRANRATPDRRTFAADGHSLWVPWVGQLEASSPMAVLAWNVGHRGQIGRYVPDQLAAVRAVAADCRAHGRRFVAFVPPAHVMEYEVAHMIGSWPHYERFMRDLAAITPYWDFSGYGAVNAEPLVAGAQLTNFLDVTHPRPEVGDRILRRMYGAGPADFGAFVTAATVEARLRAIARERAAWLATDPPARRVVQGWLAD